MAHSRRAALLQEALWHAGGAGFDRGYSPATLQHPSIQTVSAELVLVINPGDDEACGGPQEHGAFSASASCQGGKGAQGQATGLTYALRYIVRQPSERSGGCSVVDDGKGRSAGAGGAAGTGNGGEAQLQLQAGSPAQLSPRPSGAMSITDSIMLAAALGRRLPLLKAPSVQLQRVQQQASAARLQAAPSCPDLGRLLAGMPPLQLHQQAVQLQLRAEGPSLQQITAVGGPQQHPHPLPEGVAGPNAAAGAALVVAGGLPEPAAAALHPGTTPDVAQRAGVEDEPATQRGVPDE